LKAFYGRRAGRIAKNGDDQPRRLFDRFSFERISLNDVPQFGRIPNKILGTYAETPLGFARKVRSAAACERPESRYRRASLSAPPSTARFRPR
jgi:hypothetical protein